MVLQRIHVFFPSNNNKANKSFFNVRVQLDKSLPMIDRTDTSSWQSTWKAIFFFKHLLRETSRKINQQVYNIIQGLFIFLHRSSWVYSAPAGDFPTQQAQANSGGTTTFCAPHSVLPNSFPVNMRNWAKRRIELLKVTARKDLIMVRCI